MQFLHFILFHPYLSFSPKRHELGKLNRNFHREKVKEYKDIKKDQNKTMKGTPYRKGDQSITAEIYRKVLNSKPIKN